jgi:hypothetical protein
MFVGNCRYSLKFDDDFLMADEVRFVALTENPTVVREHQFFLRHEWDLLDSELDLQTLLIDRFQEAASFLL